MTHTLRFWLLLQAAEAEAKGGKGAKGKAGAVGMKARIKGMLNMGSLVEAALKKEQADEVTYR